jgi:hypothetical protein
MFIGSRRVDFGISENQRDDVLATALQLVDEQVGAAYLAGLAVGYWGE